MFWRMLMRAAMLRKRSALAALLAITVAAASATAMLNLFVEIEGRLRNEFRKFGANIVVEAQNGRSLSANDVAAIQRLVEGHGLAVPFAYAVARTQTDQPVVIAATDFALVHQLNPWWDVSAWPKTPGEALVGIRAARILGSGKFVLNFNDRRLALTSAGTVQTGADEDSRVYLSLEDFAQWTGLHPSVVEIAATGNAAGVNSLLQELRGSLPSVNVRAVRQIADSESDVLGKTRSTMLASSAFLICTAALCVLATLMGWVFDRRRDFAIMKALGSPDRLIVLFVAGEGAILGATGAVLGYAGGVGIAAWIGRWNFHAPITPRLDIFPVVLAGCVAITLLATVFPLRLLRRIEPAMILRGE